MQHILSPYDNDLPPYTWWEGAFTEEELNTLQEQAKTATTRALVGGNPDETSLKNIRRSHITWMFKNNETTWVYEKLSHVVSSMNAKHYNFDLTGFGEAIQLTNYDSSEMGMYDWHLDGGGGHYSRKLSLVVQLTDPSMYEGGNLQIMTSNDPVNVRKQRGLIALFPSFMLHRVTPVTQGTRQSLVCWITGPRFR